MATTDLFPATTTELSTSTPNFKIADADSGKSKFDAVLYLSVLKITIGIVGVLGNLMVLLILIKLDSQKVKFLLGSQAAIDMITSAVLIADAFTKLYPPTISQNPILGYLYCLFWRYEMVLFVMFALSTYNLVAISLERYILVLHPLRYRAYFTRSKEVLLGITAWILAPILQLTYAIAQESYDPEKVKCAFTPLSILDLMGVFLFIWDFFMPCLIMGFCFSRICVTLYKQDKSAKFMKGHSSTDMPTISSTVSSGDDGLASSASNLGSAKKGDGANKAYVPDKDEVSNEYRRSRNVTKTFVIIFAVFVICWSTNQFLFLQFNLGGYNHHGTPENHFANGMAILNSAVNPFIYVLHMKQYQDVLKSYFGHR